MAAQGNQSGKLANRFTATSWNQIKAIFLEAFHKSPAERDLYLSLRCTGNPEMQHEIESLLASYERAGDFIENSPITRFPAGQPKPALAPGTRIGSYALIRELGQGGMGSVYLARRADDEFEKFVAIKLVRPDMESEYLVQRFRNERQILACLEHANIAHLIDGGTTGEGLPYFVMEYIEGLPITEYCVRHRLSLVQRLQLFTQVCTAVQYAHERGIVHRDLKPSNILIKETGEPKLLDFGIARTFNSPGAASLIGVPFVTPAYASPEELRGEPATCASDIYSLGVLLLELATGQPYRSDPQQNESIPVKLRPAIRRAMHEDASSRFLSVEALAGQVCFYLSRQSDAAFHKSLAVLPFSVLHVDNAAHEYLGVAIADSLITKLSTCRCLTVKPTRSVLANQGGDPVLRGRELGVDAVLDGFLREAEGRIRITMQLIRVLDGVPVWGAGFEENAENLLKLEEDLANQVIQAVLPELSTDEQSQLAQKRKRNSTAYQAYLKGRWYWGLRTQEGLQKAFECFSEAIREDPEYADAYAGIADFYLLRGSYTWLCKPGAIPPAENLALGLQAARRAVELDPYLPEAYSSLGYAIFSVEKDHATAEQELQKAILLNAQLGTAHQRLGAIYSSQGRHEEAIHCLQKACEIEPHSVSFAYYQALCFYHAREPRLALKTVQQLSFPMQGHRAMEQIRARCLLQLGESGEALRLSQHLVETHGRVASSLMILAASQATAGRKQEARQTLRFMEEQAAREVISPWFLSLACVAFGDYQASLRHLEEAYRTNDWWTLWTGVETLFGPLRRYRRFQELLGKPQ